MIFMIISIVILLALFKFAYDSIFDSWTRITPDHFCSNGNYRTKDKYELMLNKQKRERIKKQAHQEFKCSQLFMKFNILNNNYFMKELLSNECVLKKWRL